MESLQITAFIGTSVSVVLLISGLLYATQYNKKQDALKSSGFLLGVFSTVNAIFETHIKQEKEYKISIGSGELFPDHYEKYAKIIKKEISSILKEKRAESIPKFKIRITCGAKIMVKRPLFTRFTNISLQNIHPVVELLYDSHYSRYIDLFVINSYNIKKSYARLPFHYAYDFFTRKGVGEMPHREGGSTATWSFHLNQKDHDSLTHYGNLIQDIYAPRKLHVKSGQLFIDDVLISKKNMESVFTEKKLWPLRFIAPHIRKALLDHRQLTGLKMDSWKPSAVNLFSSYDSEILSTIRKDSHGTYQ